MLKSAMELLAPVSVLAVSPLLFSNEPFPIQLYFSLKCKIAYWAAEASLKENPFMFVAKEFFCPFKSIPRDEAFCFRNLFFCAL